MRTSIQAIFSVISFCFVFACFTSCEKAAPIVEEAFNLESYFYTIANEDINGDILWEKAKYIEVERKLYAFVPVAESNALDAIITIDFQPTGKKYILHQKEQLTNRVFNTKKWETYFSAWDKELFDNVDALGASFIPAPASILTLLNASSEMESRNACPKVLECVSTPDGTSCEWVESECVIQTTGDGSDPIYAWDPGLQEEQYFYETVEEDCVITTYVPTGDGTITGHEYQVVTTPGTRTVCVAIAESQTDSTVRECDGVACH